jgi:multiple sugar transport system substrate-binding protein
MLVSPESQKYAVQNCSTLPTRKSIYTDKEMTNKCDFLALMYPQYEFAYPRPKIPNYSQWSNIIQSAISNVLTGQLDAKTALDKAVQDSNALLSQNK